MEKFEEQKLDFINHLRRVKSIKFIEYINEVKEQYFINKQYKTYFKYNNLYNKIHNYLALLNQSDILLIQIDYNFIVQFDIYLKQSIQHNTIRQIHSLLKKILNQAVKENLVEKINNPYNEFKIKRKIIRKVYLKENEIELLSKYPLPPKSNKDLYRDLYIFSCNCGGMLSNEIIKLKNKDFDGTYLEYIKYNAKLKIKVPTRALKIIEKHRKENYQPDDYLFPIRNNLIIDDELDATKKMINLVRKINQSVKNTAKKAGIQKSVNFLTSRNTFAITALKKGIRIEVLQKLMGHKNLKETEVYSCIFKNEIDKIMDNL